MDETTRQQRFETFREAFQAGITFAVGGLKTLALINGAAAVALLTFITNTGQKGGRFDPTLIKFAMWAFMFGTVAAVIASLAAFVAQDRFGRLQNHPDPATDFRIRLYRGLTFMIAGTGLVAFVLGGYLAAEAIAR